jgi:DNA replication protein DnaC
MAKIGDIVKSGEYKKPIQRRIFNCSIKPDKFSEMFISSATMRIHTTESSYFVDEDNKDVINQLYYFLVNSPNFDGDPIKGILLIGSIGGGKTVLMESFIDIFNEVSGKVMININSKDLVEVQKRHGFDYLHKRPLFIDDLGKEQTTINTYGTVSKPMEDLINDRYKTAGLTFGTSNLKLEDMPYNKHTIDRMKQMFNVIILPGKSRRD